MDIRPLTKEQRRFAEENHHLVFTFLNQKELPESVFYDVVIFGYLKAVQEYCEVLALHRFKFSTLAFQRMRSSLSNYYMPTDFDERVIHIVQEQAQQFINDIFGKLRERMIDLRSGKVVFVGGGSILLRKQIEASGKIGTPIFVDEISANTKGYELLFKAACMG